MAKEKESGGGMNPRNRKRSEATEQIRVIDWARRNEWRCEELKLLHHIPNGGSRNRAEAVNLKAQGVKSGVPDLCLPVPRKGKHGLYIEMKYGKNTVSENQAEWLLALSKNDYHTMICYSADEAIEEIAGYLDIEVTPEKWEI